MRNILQDFDPIKDANWNMEPFHSDYVVPKRKSRIVDPDAKAAMITDVNNRIMPWGPTAVAPMPEVFEPDRLETMEMEQMPKLIDPGTNWVDPLSTGNGLDGQESSLSDLLTDRTDKDVDDPNEWRPGMLTPVAGTDPTANSFQVLTADDDEYQNPYRSNSEEEIDVNSENSATDLHSQYDYLYGDDRVAWWRR